VYVPLFIVVCDGVRVSAAPRGVWSRHSLGCVPPADLLRSVWSVPNGDEEGRWIVQERA
jgi:hypothetical protein